MHSPRPRPAAAPARTIVLAAALAAAFAVALVCSCRGGRSGGPSITIRVTNGATGEAVSEANVSWAFADPDTVVGFPRRAEELRGTSGPDGTCLFPDIPAERRGSQQLFFVDVNAPGFAHTVHIDSFAFEEKRGLRLELGILPEWGEARIEGEVRDVATEKPLAGASIKTTATRLEESPAALSGDPRYRSEVQYETVSGADGRFSFPVDYFAIDRESYQLQMVVAHAGWAYARRDLGAWRQAEGRRITANYDRVNCLFFLSDEGASGLVKGQALMPDGSPASRAEIVVQGAEWVGTDERGCCGGEPRAVRMTPLVTDPQGRFSLELNAPYLFGLANGIRVGWDDEFIAWRTPLSLGQSEASYSLDFTDGRRVGLEVTFPAR